MPKTKEEMKKEFQNQLLEYFNAGDIGGFADFLIANEEILQPTLRSDHPDVDRSEAMSEALYTIFDLPDAQKTAEFMIKLTRELSMRKTDEIIRLGDVMEDYEEKIKNGEIVGTEYYADDPKSAEKIAATLTKGSQAANKVKCIESAGFTVATGMRNYYNLYGPKVVTAFEKAFDEAYEKEKNVETFADEYWESKNLPEKQYNKLRKRLECNFGDGDKDDLDYETISYRVEGDGYFAKLPGDIANMQKMTDQQLEDEMKKTVEKADPEVKFYKECEKVGAYLNVWDSIIMPAMCSTYNDKTRYAITDGIKEISETLRKDLYSGKDGLMAHDPDYVMTAINKAISKSGSFIAERETLQQKREVDGETSENSRRLADGERDMTNSIVCVGKQFKSKLEEIKSRLTQAYTPDIQAKKDTRFNKYIPAKLKAIEKNNKKLAMLRKEKQLRDEEKSAHDKMSEKLKGYLSYGGNKDHAGSYYGMKTLLESKSLGTSRVDIAKKKAVDEFIISLKDTKPANATDKNFITDLGSELSEKELKAAESFTRKKNELKKDILAGVVPGIFSATDEMAEALASDMAYFASPEGRQLKAIQETKREVFGAIKDSPNWKTYINNHPELSQNLDAPEYKSLASKYGYTVSNDLSRQINGTVFEKMPADADRLMRGGKDELQTMYNTTARKIANADALELKINDLADKAEKILAELNATNKEGHRNSGSYKRMIADLTNIANLKSGKMVNSKGQLVDITAAGVQGLLDDLSGSSKEYQEAHSGMFKGVSKGFGRTRYNASVLLQSFSASGKKSLDNELGFIDKDKSIAEYRNEQYKLLDDINKVSIDKGFGAVERKIFRSPMAKLDTFIADAQRLNERHGSAQYDAALAAAVSLKEAIGTGNAAAIEQAANTVSQRIEEYSTYKRNQILDGDLPNEKGRDRIDVMNDLKFAANLSKLYSKSISGAEADRNYEGLYREQMNAQKDTILYNKELEQQKVDSAIVNAKITQNALNNAGVNKKINANSTNYSIRSQDESLKGIDKVSAYSANIAFSTLDTFTINDTVLKPEYQQQAKQCIAELVLDKMIQLDHGNALHNKLKIIDEDQFRETAKKLSESPEFKASVPDKIDGTYVQKFMADHDDHGVMQVKNSIDQYRKAVKNINANANNAQRQPAQNVQPDAMQHHN